MVLRASPVDLRMDTHIVARLTIEWPAKTYDLVGAGESSPNAVPTISTPSDAELRSAVREAEKLSHRRRAAKCHKC